MENGTFFKNVIETSYTPKNSNFGFSIDELLNINFISLKGIGGNNIPQKTWADINWAFQRIFSHIFLRRLNEWIDFVLQNNSNINIVSVDLLPEIPLSLPLMFVEFSKNGELQIPRQITWWLDKEDRIRYDAGKNHFRHLELKHKLKKWTNISPHRLRYSRNQYSVLFRSFMS